MTRESDQYPDLTEDDVDTCYKVLEIVRDDYRDADMVDEAVTIREAYALVELFDDGVDWVDPIELE